MNSIKNRHPSRGTEVPALRRQHFSAGRETHPTSQPHILTSPPHSPAVYVLITSVVQHNFFPHHHSDHFHPLRLLFHVPCYPVRAFSQHQSIRFWRMSIPRLFPSSTRTQYNTTTSQCLTATQPQPGTMKQENTFSFHCVVFPHILTRIRYRCHNPATYQPTVYTIHNPMNSYPVCVRTPALHYREREYATINAILKKIAMQLPPGETLFPLNPSPYVTLRCRVGTLFRRHIVILLHWRLVLVMKR